MQDKRVLKKSSKNNALVSEVGIPLIRVSSIVLLFYVVVLLLVVVLVVVALVVVDVVLVLVIALVLVAAWGFLGPILGLLGLLGGFLALILGLLGLLGGFLGLIGLLSLRLTANGCRLPVDIFDIFDIWRFLFTFFLGPSCVFALPRGVRASIQERKEKRDFDGF